MNKTSITTQARRLLCAAIIATAGRVPAAAQSSIAVVPGADITGSIAIEKLNNTALITTLRGRGTKQSPRSLAAHQARLQSATGLTFSDISSAMFSCDADTYNFTGATPRAKVAKLNGLLAISLKKPVTISKLRQLIKLEYGSTEQAGVANVTIAGNPVLVIKSPTADKPDIYIAVSPDGRSVLAAFNPGAIGGALLRTKAGKLIREPDALYAMRKGLPRDAQIKIASVVPDAVHRQIDKQITAINRNAASNPGMAVTASLIGLFGNLRNISIGIGIDSDVSLTLAGDLGNSQTSQQAAILLQTIALPMMKASLQQQSGGAPNKINLDRQLKFSAKKNMLYISILIPQDQLIKTAPHQ